MTTGLDAALDAVTGPRPTPPKPAPPGVAAAVPGSPGLHTVRVDQVHPNPDNPRERMTDITDLAASIKETGLIQPLIARRTPAGTLELIAGHRRLEAVKRLGWIHVEVIVRKDMPADDLLVKALVENGQRAGLDPIEEARALMRLKTQAGLSDAQLGQKVGRSQPVVSARLALLSLPIEEQEALRAGQTTIGAAVRTARLNAGKVRPTGVSRAWHLGPDHALSNLARARCRRLGHKLGRMVGGMACGECWESVIRADERQHLHQVAARRDACPVCGQSTDTTTVPVNAGEG